ncbi:GNAT family N-acetyltransferase [Flavobacterium sp. MAH-1]|uniref:GNAT family N-acetyltransferase n=1 Tax=Flavobacterium agri TaxID=2743471 RepID=A0A7Y9C4L8_9FLAO|nr:GNAT family protein [Flavobacterium agri]NUY80311.1 GNAT family N-acetyltransferase [Flavobacterium agri]NYA70336.1 GNAT family N-acetyltransferase [Flavobacterium agri]
MNWEILETERMQLRILTPEKYLEIFAQPDAEIMRSLFLKDNDALEKEKEKHLKGRSTHKQSFVNFQLLDKSDGKYLGACGFHTWFVDHARAEIGYHIEDENMKGRGFMSEAMAQILQYGFETMELHRVEALLSPKNIPSLKLVQKFGFTREGLLRGHYFTDGQFEDSLFFSLLKHEFHRVDQKTNVAK